MPSASPDPVLEERTEDEQDPDECDRDCEDAGESERDESLAPEGAVVVAVEGGVERVHVHGHGSGRAPDREREAHDDERDAGRGSSLEPGEAVAEELRRLGRHDRPEAVHQVADRLGAREDREQADRDEQDRRNREEGAVGERGRDHRDLVVDRLLAGSDEDRAPVAPRQVASGLGLPASAPRARGAGRARRHRPCSAHREGYPAPPATNDGHRRAAAR